MSDYCHSCGENWQGECPKDPHYTVYLCQQCGRVEADNYGDREIVRDRQFSREQLETIERMKEEGEKYGDDD